MRRFIVFCAVVMTVSLAPLPAAALWGPDAVGVVVPIMQLTPALVALIMLRAERPPAGIRAALGLVRGRRTIRVAIVASAIVAACAATTQIIASVFGLITLSSVPTATFILIVPGFFLLGFFATGEDLGWRGYAHHVLHYPTTRLFIPATMWALWHLPMTIALSGTSWLVLTQALLPIFGIGLLSGVVRDITGSVWASVILHAAGNTFSPVIFATGIASPDSLAYAALNVFPLLAACVAITVWWLRTIRIHPERLRKTS